MQLLRKTDPKVFIRFLFVCVVLILAGFIDFFVGDTEVFLFINGKLSHSALDFVFLYIFVPLLSFLVVVPGFMLLLKPYRIIGILSLVGGVLCYWFGELIKFSPRPSALLAQVNLVGNWTVGETSFPSTTTMLLFGLALPVFFLVPKIGRISLLLAFLGAFFVVYSGYHFPEDAIAGAVLSLLITFPFIFGELKRAENRKIK
ncbi:phosphatase PAP2 family protein [bacterium]|nr:phosphatase PAP2 family protein [bacterium]